jgi:hypothetical protein
VHGGSCASNDDCLSTDTCFGTPYGEDGPIGEGRCLERANVVGEGNECASAVACPAGLFCAGASFAGSGLCERAEYVGTFVGINDFVDESVPLTDNGVTRQTVLVSGLSTVSTDVWLDLFIIHDDVSELTITLENPLGTTGVLPARTGGEVFLARVPMFGFPGDEPANGLWALQIVDDAAGNSGSVVGWRVTIGSRDD